MTPVCAQNERGGKHRPRPASASSLAHVPGSSFLGTCACRGITHDRTQARREQATKVRRHSTGTCPPCMPTRTMHPACRPVSDTQAHTTMSHTPMPLQPPTEASVPVHLSIHKEFPHTEMCAETNMQGAHTNTCEGVHTQKRIRAWGLEHSYSCVFGGTHAYTYVYADSATRAHMHGHAHGRSTHSHTYTDIHVSPYIPACL